MIRTFSPLLALLLLLGLFFSDVAFLGKSLSTSSFLPGTTPEGPYGFSGHKPQMPFSLDTAGNAWVNEPNPYIIRRTLDEGTLPAWNPREGLGMPLIANMNNEIFNPLKLFLNLFPDPFSQDMFFLLRLLVMGVFTYLYLSEIKLSRASSFLGASFLMFSGYSVWWINLHPLSTVMYLPAVFYFYERWGERGDLKNPFLMSLCLSFALTAGKIPDVIMGLSLLFLYAMWKGLVTPPLKLRGEGGSYGEKGIFGSMFKEGGKVILVTLSGALMASAALLPFVELYAHASPLAKAIRTGSAGHTIPLISSVSLIQPLFLGWKNYFYGSWLKWTPDLVLPHVGLVIAILSFYAVFHSSVLKKTFPYFIFSSFFFLTVYGLVPFHAVSQLPVFRSIGFLKYNAMFYFSVAVMSACAFDDLLSAEGSKKRLNLSIGIVSLLILMYFFFLYSVSPSRMNDYMINVLLLSLSGLLIMGLAFHFFKKRQAFGITVFLFLIGELFLYMPKDHPDRTDPYREPPYLKVIREREPYRITGDGSSLPPLVSDAVGLYDIRAISVLLPGDYYIFFENLLGFSLTGTNNPNPLFTATSPFIDLVGVKYIMSRAPLDRSKLQEEVRVHIGALRLVRLFEAMINHTVKGGVTYGSFDRGSEKRFSLVFPMKFELKIKFRVSEPFIFTGITLKDVPEGATAKVMITVENRVNELIIKDGRWKDQWLDLSNYLGKVITIKIEGAGSSDGRIVLGGFGLSPGYERERIISDNLLTLHKGEFDFLKYRGAYEGIHIFENGNVMDRAFIVHKVKKVSGLNDVIRELQEGINFREIGMVTEDFHPPLNPLPSREGKNERGLPSRGRDKEITSPLAGEETNKVPSPLVGEGKGEGGFSDDKVVIKKYVPDEVAIEAESKGGLLVLSDLYYPGWKVKVNGKEEQIIKTFGLLRGVVIGEGKSNILFYYQPTSFYAGCIIPAMTFAAWIAFFVISRRKAKLR